MPTKPKTRARSRELSRSQKQERFLRELRKRANVTSAAKKAKIGRRTAYEWHTTDEDFAKAWDDALEEAMDGLEEAAWTRAKDGHQRPVFQGGQHVGDVTEYSDTLMITLLKAHRPDKYRERQQQEHTGGMTIRVIRE